MDERTVLQAKRLGVLTCLGSDRLREIVQHMADDDISALVVTDEDGYLTGIITRSDLLVARATSADWPQASVDQFMTRTVVTVTPDTLLSEVVQILLSRQIHRVVVVRDEGGQQRPIAVLSDSDLVCEMATEI